MKNNLLILLAAVLFISSNIQVVGAITPEDQRAINLGAPQYYGGEVDEQQGCFNGGGNVESLPESVPEPYNSLFPEAAAEYDVDVGILAVVFYVENRGFPPEDTDWPVSSGGAKGPFQFLDDTWDGYGVDADGDGTADVNSLEDSSYGAANYLDSLDGNTGLSQGSLDQDFSEENADEETVAWVLKSYNAGPNTYRETVNSPWYRPAGGDWGSDKQDEINTYIEMGLDKYQEFAGNESGFSGGEGCGGLGVTEDLTFPVISNKQEIREGVDGGVWCYESTTNCHGSYNAVDIHAPIGTPVVAAVGGTVISAHNGSSSLSVRIKGNDGLYYFYQHMAIGSEQVSENDSVEAGDVLGEIGDREAAQNTAPHLHFDVAPERVGISRSCVEQGECDEERELMIDSQPQVVEAYNELPER